MESCPHPQPLSKRRGELLTPKSRLFAKNNYHFNLLKAVKFIYGAQIKKNGVIQESISIDLIMSGEVSSTGKEELFNC
jgi:hypothetical protein